MDLKEQKIEDIRKQLANIIENIEEKALKEVKLHEVELTVFRGLLKMGLSLLSYYIFTVSELVKLKGVPKDSQGEKMKHSGRYTRPYRSVFGELGINRPKYYSSTDKTFYPLDKTLGLPSGKYSYVLTDWLGYGAVDLDFAESVNFIERILGQKLQGEQSSRQTYHLSKDVSAYYEAKDWSTQEEGSHLSVGFDGKGVPIIRSETDRAKESVSARLGRGQKKGVKKEATVCVSSSFTPRPRQSKEILDNLFKVKEDKVATLPKKRHKWHENKHTRAFLSAKEKAINYGLDNVLKRDITEKKPIIVLIDGDRSLRNGAQEAIKKRGIENRVTAYILDFIHVVEYIWKVANAYKGEKSEEREEWVKQQSLLLLEGKVEQVIEQWQKISTLKTYSVNQAYNIKRGITYFTNHKDMMQYDVYLKEGYPITTGAIESACGHFVKSRMERNAMHWSKKGAQDMLNIRAIKKNGDWDQYTAKFIIDEQNSLYKMAA